MKIGFYTKAPTDIYGENIYIYFYEDEVRRVTLEEIQVKQYSFLNWAWLDADERNQVHTLMTTSG